MRNLLKYTLITLLLIAGFASQARAEVWVSSTTISGTTATTASFTVNFTGLIDDIYMLTPGSGLADNLFEIKNNTLPLIVYSTTWDSDDLVTGNQLEFNDIDTWVAPGSTIEIGFKKSGNATTSTFKIVVFYKDP